VIMVVLDMTIANPAARADEPQGSQDTITWV
jgi:hypothetical protein